MKKTEDKVKEEINDKFKDGGRNAKPNRRNRRRNGGYKKEKGGNDLSWHAKSAQLLNDSSNIPWSYASGLPIRTNSGALDGNSYLLPGIQTIKTVMVPGVGKKATDAVNVAAQAIYTRIRRDLKSANNYDPADVMIYIMAMAEVLACISWCSRAYATTMAWSFESVYTPDALLRCQGLDPDSFHNHGAEFRSRLNQTIAKASQIWFPKGFDYLSRARWEYANYYSEGKSIKDQIYMFVPGLFRKFTLLESADYSGGLVPFTYIPEPSQTLLTWEDMVAILDEMIEAIVGDSDFHNIAGDLFNCFGAGAVETFSLIPEDVVTVPLFNYEVLEQMMNVTCLPQIHDIYYHYSNSNNRDGFFSIYQDENVAKIVVPNQFNTDLVSSAITDSEWYAAATHNKVLTVHEDPNPAKTMLITRLCNTVEHISTDEYGKWLYEGDAACEWIIGINIYYYDTLKNLQWDTWKSFMFFSNTDFIRALARKGAFHYSPMVAGVKTAPSGQDVYPWYHGEQDIVAVISNEQIRDMNRVDLMSMFAVPDVGHVSGK